MMAADSGLSAPIPARYDDEQPSPNTGFSTTRAVPKSTCSRTSSTARPRTTTTSSRLDARRAWSTTQPSIVVPRKGRSCFGGPSLCEAPAPRTNPEINVLILSSANLCDLRLFECLFATQTAELDTSCRRLTELYFAVSTSTVMPQIGSVATFSTANSVRHLPCRTRTISAMTLNAISGSVSPPISMPPDT